MKQRSKRIISILMTICLVLTLLPAPSAKADSPETITITKDPTETNAVTFGSGETAAYSVSARASSGSAISFRWYYAAPSGTTAPVDASGAVSDDTSSTLTLTFDDRGLSPGVYGIYCVLTTESGASVESRRGTLTVDKGTVTLPEFDTYYVKSNQAEEYTLQLQSPSSDMSYTVTGSAISALIDGTPAVSHQGFGEWELRFRTTAQPAGTEAELDIVLSDGYFYYGMTRTLTVRAVDKLPVSITGITGRNATYSGYGQSGYSGTPTAVSTLGTYEGELIYHYSGTEASGTAYDRDTPPMNAGDYTLTVSVPDTNPDYTGSASVDFSILKKEVTVHPTDQYINRGDELPMPEDDYFSFWYEGFIGPDDRYNSLSVMPVLSYPVTDTSQPGTYEIGFARQAQLNTGRGANYTLRHEPGILSIAALYGGADVVRINLPGASITDSSITATVAHTVSSFTLDATVSPGATWALYRDSERTIEIAKTVEFVPGANTVYLEVTSENRIMRHWYTVTITRQSAPTATPTPTPTPTATPTAAPTTAPTATPTAAPTLTPTAAPTAAPTPTPTTTPTAAPTAAPTTAPTATPTATPAPTPQAPSGGNNSSMASDYSVTGNNIESWSQVMQALQGGDAGQLNIDMAGTTILPGAILEELAGKNITVTLTFGDGISWIIQGNGIRTAEDGGSTADWQDIDLKAEMGTGQIPGDVLEELAEQPGAEAIGKILQLSLFHEGSFGFTARLSVYIGSSMAGRTANLFYYNPDTRQLELICIATVDSEGYTVFPFSHASDYAIAVDDGALLQAELDKLVLTPAKKTLYAGGNTGKSTVLKLNLPDSLSTLTGEDSLYPAVTYTSSNPKVAVVTAEGKVNAKKAGKATITATVTAGGVSKVLKTDITVKEAYIKLVKYKSSFKKGESFTYTATGYGVSIDKIIWSTTKKSVVVIDKKTGKAIAKSVGTDYVTAKYGSIKKVIKVTVK